MLKIPSSRQNECRGMEKKTVFEIRIYHDWFFIVCDASVSVCKGSNLT